MGYLVVEFDQMFIMGDQHLKFTFTTKIIWKLRDGVWQESLYHSSLISMGPV
ncbi:hypothetical protein H7169_03195 [Candidatus Gracilibacteria bacterium]|nr:hypothetical protein [Candidatus Gracilibacteria bacterium]